MLSQLKKYLFLLGSAITIYINYLAVALPINNVSTAEVSDKFYTVLTSAGFTFAIWGVIYTGLVFISILIAANQYKISDKGLVYFLLSCLSNCLWIFSWQYYHLFISSVLLVALVVLNTLTYLELNKPENSAKKTVITSLYLIYLGWSIVAAVINITAVLKYDFVWRNLSLDTQAIWGSLVLFIALGINLVFGLKKNNVTTLLVFLWAITGIQSAQSNSIIDNAVTVLYVLTVISIGYVLYQRDKPEAVLA